jgi:hypothetical protein
MSRKFLAAGLFALLPALAACDPSAVRTQAKADSPNFDASDPKNAPEPARFGAKAEPLWQAGPEPTSSASSPSASSLQALAAPTVSAYDAGRKIFDGSRDAGSAPAAVRARIRSSGAAPVTLSNKQMSIDTDGLIADPAVAKAVKARDRWHQDDTSYHYANGKPLDPMRVPYISLPLDYAGAKTGDLALVEYNGRQVWAVCGDRGPKGKFGEASSAAAAALGINPDGLSGGVRRGVTYTLFPGTAGSRPRDENALLAYIDDNKGPLYARLGRRETVQLAMLP